mmetsp:Transcript_157699/g.290527  ORF Transcript_157699/g.290527 Transcript_157699/m.290527 type:complete len:271 (+) Transcript_157699:74-886(+)
MYSVLALTLLGHAAASMSRSTAYCHEDNPFPANCWNGRPDVEYLPECTVSTGSAACRCPRQGDSNYLTARCDLQEGSDTNPLPSMCRSLLIYNASTFEKTLVCQDMVAVDGFPTRPASSRRRGEASYSNRRRHWLKGAWCDEGYTYGFNKDECVARERYAGESCWNGWSSGECQNGGLDKYDTRRLSCVDLSDLEGATPPELADPRKAKGTANAKCVPSIHVYGGPRPQTTCAGFRWGVTCAAKHCNGHAGVRSTGDGKTRCDWHTKNDW